MWIDMNELEGVVPHVERQPSHQKFVRTAEPHTILLKITYARRMWKNDETFDDYFREDTDVITTTTVRDSYLQYIHLTDPGVEEEEAPHEWEIVRDLEPDYHIPTDHSDYDDLPIDERVERIKKTMKGTVWMHNRINEAGKPTTILPLLKGRTQQEREICYATFDELGIDTAAVYATTYFTRNGNQFWTLKENLEAVQEERPDLDLFIMGLLSPNYVEKLPDNVVGVAGQKQWREATQPRNSIREDIYYNYQDFEEEVDQSLPRSE